jgi:hypothetical protein
MPSKFLLCIKDGGHPESLEPRKFYEVVDDPDAAAEKMVRVIDESGEDYLHPRSCFVEVPLSSSVKRQLRSG